MFYCADQNVVFGEISHLSYCKTSYPIYSVFPKGIKSSIGLNFTTNILKSPSTPKNGATNSVISGITTPFPFSNINPNDTSLKK